MSYPNPGNPMEVPNTNQYGQQSYYPQPQGDYPAFGSAYPPAPVGQYPYPPTGGPPMWGPPVGVPPMGGPPVGVPPMVGPPMAGQQPIVQWMPTQNAPDNCPPGLQYLIYLDQLWVKQKKELLEIVTDIETQNKYTIYNSIGQMVYSCEEESDFCTRQCCGSDRPFVMHIKDNLGMEVIRITRPYKYMCCSQCCSVSECCFDELEVETPIGHTVGYVKQVFHNFHAHYHILDRQRNTVLQIGGPHCCHCQCIGEDVNFKVLSSKGEQELGNIVKKWTNIIQEYFTDADNFGVRFPLDLDVRFKAILIAAVFLIDFMYFEDNQPRRNENH